MSNNRSARRELERLFGKKCMIEELGIRYIPTKERRKIKGYTKYDECITFHHIIERQNGGESTPENGALIRGYNHRWLHSLPDYQKEQINEMLQQYKVHLLANQLKLDEFNKTQEICSEIQLDFNPKEFIRLPAFKTEKKSKKNKFNRAREKREFKKLVEEALYYEQDEIDIEEEVDDMSRIVDPRDMMIRRLHNSVKGHAQLVLMDHTMTPEERKEEFDIIEEFLYYVDNYYENQKRLDDYDRIKTEYERLKDRLSDDGR